MTQRDIRTLGGNLVRWWLKQDGITQKQLLDKHLKWAKVLGTEAIDKALKRAGIERKDIKFLVVASSTGFLIPPLTCHLTECMGLSPHIQVCPLPVT